MSDLFVMDNMKWMRIEPYLNTIIYIRDGFEKKEAMSESMSQVERTRIYFILENGKMSKNQFNQGDL